MEYLTGLALALPIGVGLAGLGCGIGLGNGVRGAMEAIGRQPEASAKIQTAMILGAAFIEALTIYALVTVFYLAGAIKDQAKVDLERSKASVAVSASSHSAEGQ